jgi:uncharacterized membrane protein YgdD (TMEM256/DUF423 family)
MGCWAVAMGAFGAHALRDRLEPNLLNAYQTGAAYHLVHSVVLLALALYGSATSKSLGLAPPLLLAGTLLFSGSLYVMAVTGVRGLGAVTPFGGVLLLLGWGAIAWQLARA